MAPHLLVRPANKSTPRLAQSISRALRAAGAASVLTMAVLVNAALMSDAFARVSADQPQITSFVPADPQEGAPAEAPAAVDEQEARYLAATIWAEARSEGEEGMRAVAHVIANRRGERFGASIESVVLSPYQFSAWNRGDPNRRLAMHPERYATRGVNLETWETAQRIAREVLAGQSADPTGGALFYHTTAIRPYWARYGQGRQVIGAHAFYADVLDRTQRRAPQVTQVGQTFDTPIPIDAPAAQGPRAGRVNGVIQHAPASAAHQTLPSETVIDANAAATPTINGVPITQLRATGQP